MNAAEKIIVRIKLKASLTGFWIKLRSALEVAGFWLIESEMMFRMMKRTKPIIDAMRRKANFFATRQGWTNASTPAIAAKKASSTPSGLSSIPTMAEEIANKTLTPKRINILIR